MPVNAGRGGIAMRVPLVHCSVLDPRPADDAARTPLPGAVNIPVDELPRRTHELPPRAATITVGGQADLARAAVAWLRAAGRNAVAGGAAADAIQTRIQTPISGIDALGRLWSPNDFLAAVLPALPPGHALDLACGTGRDAVYLASCGWDVTAVDILPDALARARDLARRCAAAIVPIRFCCADLELEPRAEAATDWCTPPFDLIAGFRYLHRPLLRRLPELLRPGGSLIWETFTTLHRTRHGRPASDARVLRPGELRELLLHDLDVREYEEVWQGEAHTARIWATRRADQ